MKIIWALILACFHLVLSAQSDHSIYDKLDRFLNTYVSEGFVKYQEISGDPLFIEISSFFANKSIDQFAEPDKKALAINAYNVAVLQAVMNIYPTTSVQKEFGFFDQEKRQILGQKITLNEFEKTYLLDQYNDPRLHFVLVCAAISCPPLIAEAYRPNQLDQQLDRQTRLALNDPEFIKVTEMGVGLSQIFSWYKDDFGSSNENILSYINQYRDEEVSTALPLSHYGYNWQLNDQEGIITANSARYIVSAAIPQGTYEVKVFNNLYSQRTVANGELSDRSTFFTTSISAIHGFTNRFNAGVEIRYRRVLNEALPSSAFEVFQSGHGGTVFRQGITALGPRIRFAPIPKWQNFSIQSTLSFPIGKNLAGTSEQPYIDWNGISFNTQLFNDKAIGNHFSLFTELDFFIEDLGPVSANHANRFSTPVTAIISYFPNTKTTIYGLSGFSPFWQSTFDYFVQAGIGTKYQFTPNFELEFLYTKFSNKFLTQSGGKAETINFGIRSNF